MNNHPCAMIFAPWLIVDIDSQERDAVTGLASIEIAQVRTRFDLPRYKT